jgi:hypothetical protein
VNARDDDEHLARVHDGADAHSERALRHLGDVVVEEARVGDDRVLSLRTNGSPRYTDFDSGGILRPQSQGRRPL